MYNQSSIQSNQIKSAKNKNKQNTSIQTTKNKNSNHFNNIKNELNHLRYDQLFIIIEIILNRSMRFEIWDLFQGFRILNVQVRVVRLRGYL